jgi:threonine/homoserine/homoserine lactone efflux protein
MDEQLLTFLSLWLWGMLFGLGAAVPIGPINSEMARRTLRAGFLTGAAFGSGAVTVDIVFALLACYGVGTQLAGNGAFKLAITIPGAILLALLGLISLWEASKHWRARRVEPTVTRGDVDEKPMVKTGYPFEPQKVPTVPYLKPAPEPSTRTRAVVRSFFAGLLMTLVNPYTWGFWFVALPAAAAEQIEEAHRDIPALVAGVFTGTFGWVVAFTGLLAYLKRFQQGWWMAAADLVGGLMLLGFSVLAVLTLLR